MYKPAKSCTEFPWPAYNYSISSPIHDIQTFVWSHSTLQLIRRARSEKHRHAALQLALGLEGEVQLGDSVGSASPVSDRVVLVAANQDHWFECSGWAAVLWVEPESRVGRLFASAYLQETSISALPEEAGVTWANWSHDIPRESAGSFEPPRNTTNEPVTVPFDPVLVAGWLNAPSTVEGLLLRNSLPEIGIDMRFFSSEAADGVRPRFRIEYEICP